MHELFIQPQKYLILAPSDTKFHQSLKEAAILYTKNPSIEQQIIADQDRLAKQKKAMRVKDNIWKERSNAALPGMECSNKFDIDAENLVLADGHSRMSPFVVFIYMCIRGQLGCIKSQEAQQFQDESTTLMLFLEQYCDKKPGASTVLDNLNALSTTTMETIFKAQVLYIIGEKLDNFNELTIDSTAIKGNTTWPVESRFLMRLVKRIYHIGSKLDRFGIASIQERNFPKLITDMTKIDTQIAFECGKTDSATKRKAHYKKQLNKAQSAKGKFDKEMVTLLERVEQADMLPSCYAQLLHLIDIMKKDIINLQKMIDYCRLRVMNGKTTPSTEKFLSMSDDSAACIVKGGREIIFGYKSQLSRSKNGFVSCIITPEGNASDSGQLNTVIETHIMNTEIIPIKISTDDGYANTKIRQEWLDKDVKIFSISGSKGKKLTPEDEYNSEAYHKARNDRSAVESLMFCLKQGFHFSRVMRRGIENVRKELMEKVLAYNFLRIGVMGKRLQLSV